MNAALLLAILSTYHPPLVVLALQDTGWGHCSMDQHWHAADDSCHRDSDDSAVRVLR